MQRTRLLCPWDFLDKKTGVSCHLFFRGIFLTRELNPHLPALAHLESLGGVGSPISKDNTHSVKQRLTLRNGSGIYIYPSSAPSAFWGGVYKAFERIPRETESQRWAANEQIKYHLSFLCPYFILPMPHSCSLGSFAKISYLHKSPCPRLCYPGNLS